ncbi:hypothetical protein GUITHDRAFT_71256 [Guillardia theta CCMP2712]|uniref:Acylphosphatase n=2 Tax=Guillardia theta TaxID=55529 RepID=L1JAZ3_GUITC|nr:hypothetical protein GUITHDRAFT_71256 [Guillardia theta CCMP2712]EKX45708.1 hypothetical protein GUITHDRAFT_71256 [Guillardia theta CCMP2712]|eukprot:XP_005832688.1 hypothetical protein GUITHDRAFT_71256 [Guillardia theta CCMP2712]
MSKATAAGSHNNISSFSFEVFGKVQGVFFRKYTQKKALELHLTGWVANTERGTVVGEAEGSPSKLRIMEEWLRTTGSPKSKIEKLEVKDRKQLNEHQHKSFDVRH